MQTEAAPQPHVHEFFAVTKKWSGWLPATSAKYAKTYASRQEAQAAADLDVARERAAGLTPIARRPALAKQEAS